MLNRQRQSAVQRAALQLPPRRTAKSVKIARISRAEGGQLQAPVGRRAGLCLQGTNLGCYLCYVERPGNRLFGNSRRQPLFSNQATPAKGGIAIQIKGDPLKQMIKIEDAVAPAFE
jgi:hypothetical protein